MVLTAFLVTLLGFLVIGLASAFFSRGTTEDYLIAGKDVPPLLVGLSAVATNNSGFMFIGMIGLTYTMGLASVWLMIGWIVGDLIASLLALKNIQHVSRRDNIHSYGGLLSHWQSTNYHKLRFIAGIITIVFLTVYAAAQLKAGSKATAILLHWQDGSGVLISAAIVLVYSFAGGIRASIWTDVAQSIVMLIGMLLLCYVAVAGLGGVTGTLDKLQQLGPAYMQWFPDKSPWGIFLFITGWLFGGMGVLGQPHIVIRFMALNAAESIGRMRLYYYGWFTLFYGLTIVAGLLSRLTLPDVNLFDAEMALPEMARQLLPESLAGLVLAAMFAATMSTADSLILACSAAFTRDVFQGREHQLWAVKGVTLMVLVVAVFIALADNQTVFKLVLDAWGMLGSAFAPLLLCYAFGMRVAELTAIIMLVTGLAVFVLCSVWPVGGYALVPGMLAGFAVALVAGRLQPQKS